MNRKSFFIILPLILASCIVGGVYLGALLSNNSGNRTIVFPTEPNFNPANKLNEVLNFIESTYVDTINRKELTEQTITAMLSKLDPHSYYISATDFNNANDPLEGNFDGIGVEFRIKDDTVMIVSPISGGPSEKLGIKAGDRIVKVDTTNIAGIKIENSGVIKLLKGPRGTKVNIKVVRKGVRGLLDFTITRDKIPLFSIDAPYMVNEHTGYLKITRFAKTTYPEFLEATNKLRDEGMENLIIDLRNNGGGVLTAATDIADEILSSNKMIVYTDGRTRQKAEYFSTKNGSLETCKVAILINENSASASEILAGAIQDNDRGVIIGRRSFGKGLVQEQVVWPDNSALRLTVARYYTPTGRCIQKSYENGAEEYHLEAYERYNNGELLSADSIHFPDSLKFYTPDGKVVYGGGGIMPDKFIPIDTAGNSAYLYELRYKGVVQEFALGYADNNRAEILKNYKDELSFKNKFNVSNDLFNSLIKFAEEKEVKKDLEQIKQSRQLIYNSLKASISRNIFNNLGYYVIINEYDKTVQKAIKSFN